LDHVTFVSDLSQVPDLRARFTADLQGRGVEGDELDGWALCFTEAVNNGVEHGCRCPGDRVCVGWSVDHGQVVVSVANPGDEALCDADFETATIDDFVDSGRGAGLFLIRAWADEVKVRHDGSLTEVRITRRRASAASPGGGER
jgi:anti-sigma regulatory factor (Ser/Thr protein kinase)